MINVAVMGYGTIGSGVVEVITANQKIISERTGEKIEVKYVLDLRDFPGSPVEDILVKDYKVIVDDPEVDIVVETMGGVNPAYQFVKECLENGKSVCTSNKELVASHGAQLLEIAGKNSVNFFFEASVGGGIPVIRPLNQSLTAEVVEEIAGILNGTTNFILTKMRDSDADFDSVLKEAQELGYAERNPEADVEGYDACRKIAILTSLAHGRQVDYDDIYTEGITKITAVDFRYARKMNCTIKLVGRSRLVDGKVSAIVAPMLIKEGHPLYTVDDVFNAIFIRGNMLGDSLFYGRGAGKLPTASAVVSDVIEAARNKGRTANIIWKREKLEIEDSKNVKNVFFVRVKETPSIVSEVSSNFGVVEPLDIGIEGECAFITQDMTEGEFESKIANIPEYISSIRFL